MFNKLSKDNEKYFLYFFSLSFIFLSYTIISNIYLCVDTNVFPDLLKKMLHPAFLPPTQEILLFLVKSIMDGTLQIHLFSSFSRTFIGLIVGTILGFLMGFLMAWFKKIDYTLDPIYELLRPIPPISFVTLFILWFGIGDFSIILLIIYGSFVVTLIPTYHAIKEVPDIYFKAAKVLGANTKMLLLKVVFPAASPRILAGFRYAVMGAWGMVVAAELIGSTSGIGYLISKSQATLDTHAVLAGIMVLVSCAFIFDAIVRFLISYLTRWMKRGRW